MDTNYEIIQPPVSLNFQDLDRTQARIYYKWFLSQIQVRIDKLTHYIQSTPDFEKWDNDFSPNSLDDLGEWFCLQVSTEKRSKKEIENIYSKAPDWFRAIQIPDYDITMKTASLSFDISMYVSQVMQRNNSGLRWKLITGSKFSSNYQQPILTGKGKMVFNPFDIILTYAYGIARGSKGPERLRELYDIWVNILAG